MTIQETLAKQNINIDFEAMKNHVDKILQKEGEVKTKPKIRNLQLFFIFIFIIIPSFFTIKIIPELIIMFKNIYWDDIFLSEENIFGLIIFSAGTLLLFYIIIFYIKKILLPNLNQKKLIFTNNYLKNIKSESEINFKNIEKINFIFNKSDWDNPNMYTTFYRILLNIITWSSLKFWRFNIKIKTKNKNFILFSPVFKHYYLSADLYKQDKNHKKTNDLVLNVFIWLLSQLEQDKNYEYKIIENKDINKNDQITIKFNKIK